MVTKPQDVMYCNVDMNKIKTAKPKLNEEVVEHLFLYLTERHNIYKKKEIEKSPAPWTKDEVLANYKFTNVRRELDRESKWLIKHISENDKLSLEEKIYWSMLFRAYNKSETFNILGMPETLDILKISIKDIEQYKIVIDDYTEDHPKYVWYTNAFNCGGLKQSWALPSKNIYMKPDSTEPVRIYYKNEEHLLSWRDAKAFNKQHPEFIIEGKELNMPARMLHLIKFAVDNNIAQDIIDAKDQNEVFTIIQRVPGFARFLAYQIFVDLTYIKEFQFSENEFTISGPGCDLGLSFTFDDTDGMNSEEALFWLRDNIVREWKNRGMIYNADLLFDHLPKEDRFLSVMALENAHCELSKMVKAKRGTGRPRCGYKPHQNQIEMKEW